MIDRLLADLRSSGYRGLACRRAGISEDVLLVWERRDPAFSDRVRAAELDAEQRHVLNLHAAAFGEKDDAGKWVRLPDWRASLVWLERRKHAEWGRKDRMALTGPDGGPVVVQGEVVVYRMPDNGRGDGDAPVMTTNGRRRAYANGNGNGNGARG